LIVQVAVTVSKVYIIVTEYVTLITDITLMFGSKNELSLNILGDNYIYTKSNSKEQKHVYSAALLVPAFVSERNVSLLAIFVIFYIIVSIV